MHCLGLMLRVLGARLVEKPSAPSLFCLPPTGMCGSLSFDWSELRARRGNMQAASRSTLRSRIWMRPRCARTCGRRWRATRRPRPPSCPRPGSLCRAGCNAQVHNPPCNPLPGARARQAARAPVVSVEQSSRYRVCTTKRMDGEGAPPGARARRAARGSVPLPRPARRFAYCQCCAIICAQRSCQAGLVGTCRSKCLVQYWRINWHVWVGRLSATLGAQWHAAWGVAGRTGSL